MADPKYKDIMKAHRPSGYQLFERKMKRHYGVTTFKREITVEPIVDRFSLFIYLHECGHVHCRHIPLDGQIPTWREEYEADVYAIKAMRAAGYAVPRKALAHSRMMIRALIKADGHVDDEEVLRYAFGRNWRQHK